MGTRGRSRGVRQLHHHRVLRRRRRRGKRLRVLQLLRLLLLLLLGQVGRQGFHSQGRGLEEAAAAAASGRVDAGGRGDQAGEDVLSLGSDGRAASCVGELFNQSARFLRRREGGKFPVCQLIAFLKLGDFFQLVFRTAERGLSCAGAE